MPRKTIRAKSQSPVPAAIGHYPYKCPVHKQSWSSQAGLANHLRDVTSLALQRGVPCTDWQIIPTTIPDFNTVPFPGPKGPKGGLACTPFPAPGPPPLFKGRRYPKIPQMDLTKWDVPSWAIDVNRQRPSGAPTTKPHRRVYSLPK
jgi:hypothetical protein